MAVFTCVLPLACVAFFWGSFLALQNFAETKASFISGAEGVGYWSSSWRHFFVVDFLVLYLCYTSWFVRVCLFLLFSPESKSSDRPPNMFLLLCLFCQPESKSIGRPSCALRFLFLCESKAEIAIDLLVCLCFCFRLTNKPSSCLLCTRTRYVFFSGQPKRKSSDRPSCVAFCFVF